MAMTPEDAEYIVDDCVYIELRKNQIAALVSLCCAIGEYNFRRSKIVALLNEATESSILKAATLFTSYGSPTKKNIKQRAEEAKLFLRPECVVNRGKNASLKKHTL